MLEKAAVTVTCVPEAPSPRLVGFGVRLTDGAASSSVISTVVPVTDVLRLVPDTPTVSLPSTRVSWVGVRVNVPVALVPFAAILMMKSLTAA